jgi:hypothetical protein
MVGAAAVLKGEAEELVVAVVVATSSSLSELDELLLLSYALLVLGS